MTDLDKIFGKERVIDTPVSELACTGAAIGASLFGYRPIVIHPRMDFMLLAVDQIVNQAAKWSHMLGGQASPSVTIRGIVNRGGEQGAQHSQALHAWFMHIPGLRVVMPATVRDARDLLIASALCDDPVLYIDDRWLYEQEDVLPAYRPEALEDLGPRVLRTGTDVTLVGASYSTLMCEQAAARLDASGISAEVVDLRIVNPLSPDVLVNSVNKTRRLCVVDGGWRSAGLSAEVIAAVAERTDVSALSASPIRITPPDTPAPTSAKLEDAYYPTSETVVAAVKSMFLMNRA